MQDRPNFDELLEAVAGFLQDDVLPNTTGRLSFHARVAGNVIQMLRRELSLEEEHLAREWTGLDALLGVAVRPESLSSARAQLIARNQLLADRIRAGDADTDPFRDALFAHLRQVMRDKLAVSNPGLLALG
jgi:Domain of unknown function (DUF6285)